MSLTPQTTAAALQFLEKALEVRPEWTIGLAVHMMYRRWPATCAALESAVAEQALTFFGHRVSESDVSAGFGAMIFDEHDATTPDDRLLVVSMAALAADLEHTYAV